MFCKDKDKIDKKEDSGSMGTAEFMKQGVKGKLLWHPHSVKYFTLKTKFTCINQVRQRSEIDS